MKANTLEERWQDFSSFSLDADPVTKLLKKQNA